MSLTLYYIPKPYQRIEFTLFLTELLFEEWHAHDATCPSVRSFKISPDGKAWLLLNFWRITVLQELQKAKQTEGAPTLKPWPFINQIENKDEKSFKEFQCFYHNQD